MPDPHSQTAMAWSSRRTSGQRLVHWKFVALSSLFFIAITLIYITTFSIQRINDHEAEQAAAASAFISQLMVIAGETEEQHLDDVVPAFLGTLTGVKIFSCIHLTIESLKRSYGWPYPDCPTSREPEASDLEISANRVDPTGATIHIIAILDDGVPAEKFATEAKHIALSALIMGLIALLAVNFAFNRAVRQPLRNLHEELLETLDSPGEVPTHSLQNKTKSTGFISTYEALRKRAWDLKRKEAFWRAVTDSSFDCIISEDRGGHIIDFNAASEKIFGYRREDVIGKRTSDLLFTDHYRSILKHEWANRVELGDSQTIGKTLEAEALTSSGETISVELSIAAITLEGEQYFTTYLRDVTEVRRALNSRKENEAMMTQSAEMAHLGYAVWDDTLDRDISVSEELARIHGLSREEYQKTVVSMDAYLELVVPEDREKYLAYEADFNADTSDKIASVEYRITRLDGEIRYLHQRSQYIQISSGKPSQSIVVIQDVTEQKQAELVLKQNRQALEDSEASLVQSAEMANLGHCIWDITDNKYLTVSERWAAIHGFSTDEFLAKFRNLESDEQLIHPDDLERYRYWSEHKESKEIEYRIIRRDGAIRHVLERYKELFEESGELTRELLTILDITERIERENELNEARKAAEQASIAKSSFLAVMSHEIRTPLNAVLGAFALIESKDLNPTARKFLDVGKKGAESLLLIVNDILDFSKIEAGKLHLEPALFNVQKTIDDVLQVLEPRALEKRILLTGNVDPDLPEFLIGDASRIRQILLNLCSNAVRFTSKGSVKISLTNTWSGDGLTRIRFRVSDTGIGVPIEDQKYLFEEFWGTNATTKGNIGGTGLGLPISKQLVEMMGGSIGFESVPDYGSVFWFELPLEVADQEVIGLEKNRSESLRKSRPYGDLTGLQGRVLLAEDNPANQLIGQTILERMGLQVGIAANGHEVIESLRSVPYDLVLMDINMPEMNGIEATSAIRQLPESLASIPIIAMTALAMPGDREKFLSQGMDGYVSKPISREELYDCLSTVLNGDDLPNTKTSKTGNIEKTSADTPIIDITILDALRRDVGAELLPQIVDAFLSELSGHVLTITAASRSGDCKLIAAEAHPLKSSSAYFGAMALKELASQLEQAGNQRDLQKIHQKTLQLPQLSAQTETELVKALSNLQPFAPIVDSTEPGDEN